MSAKNLAFAALAFAALSGCRDPEPPPQARAFGGVLSPIPSPPPNDYASTHLEWIDEWLAPCGANNTPCQATWTTFLQGTGAAFASAVAVGRPGILTASTGTTTTGYAGLDGGAGTSVDFGTGSWTAEWTGGFTTLSTSGEEYAFYVGFGDNATAVVNQIDGCGFLYDRGNVATNGANSGNLDRWECYCASNSTRTVFLMNGSGNSDESFPLGTAAVAALTLPNTNINSLSLRMTGATRAEFFVDGVKKCNIATNIPTGAARVHGPKMLILKSAGTTARLVSTDRIKIAVDLSAARSP